MQIPFRLCNGLRPRFVRPPTAKNWPSKKYQIVFLSVYILFHLEIVYLTKLDFHEEIAPGIIGDYMIEPKLILYNGRRYWKSVHDNGKYAVWNCGIHWNIGETKDMPKCLSWAQSDQESKVKFDTKCFIYNKTFAKIHSWN